MVSPLEKWLLPSSWLQKRPQTQLCRLRTRPAPRGQKLESAKSPSSPALVATSAQADQALLREFAEAEVVDSTPPDSTTAADPGASGAEQPSLGSETLEVECREALRTKWLTFAYRPDECAAATLGRCRNEAAMSSFVCLARQG